MSIQELSLKFKAFFRNPEYLLTLLIIAVSLASFYLGRLSVRGEMAEIGQEATASAAVPQKELEKADTLIETPKGSATIEPGGYVASKSGTKYHLPWCGGAKQIKEANKIWFATKEEAEAAGYTPASNCKGI